MDELILDRYRPLEKAGAGAFGTVQVAWDTTIQRKVAIKCIRLSAADAYALKTDGARNPGAVSRGTDDDLLSAGPGIGTASAGLGVSAASRPGADEFGFDLDADDGLGAGLGDGTTPIPEDTAEEARNRAAGWFGRTFGALTEKLPETSAQRGKGITPVAQSAADGAPVGQGGKLSEHWLTDLPGLDEARTAALLSDAHIVAVYDFQVVGLMAYLIMEYVEGMTLTRFLRDHDDDLSLDIIAAVFHDISRALAVAHASGVLHLDIKPDNVLIDKRGQVKVTDFGLATLADEMGFGLAGGGTIGYMPPEQMYQEQLDARTDEWALASILYEMLTGKNPFVSANTLDDALALIDEAELVLPSLCWRGLDAGVDDVVFKALDPERDERYDSVEEFAEALEPYLGDSAEGHKALEAIVGSAKTGDLMETAAPGIGSGAGAPAFGVAGRAPATSGAGITGRPGPYAYGSTTPSTLDLRADAAGAGALTVDTATRPADVPASSAASAQPKGKRTTASRAHGHFFGIWARIIGFFFSGAVMLLACMNVPLFSTFQEPFIQEVLQAIWPAALAIPALQNSFLWAVVVACAVLAVIKPAWGALGALTGLGIAVAWQGNLWMGILFVVITWLWWFCTGRHGGAQANCGLAYPIFGSFGCAPFATLATGIGMRVLDAAMTALFGIFCCMICASFGSGDIMDWHLGTYWNFTADDFSAGLSAAVGSMRNWVIAASWLIAAAVGGLCTMPRKRWINIVGTVAAGLIIVAGLFAATWVGSGQTTWAPGTWPLVKTLLSAVVAIGAACVFVPEPYRRKRARTAEAPGAGGEPAL